MKYTIELELLPPTINKYIGRTNRWEYQKDKKLIHKAICDLGLPRYDIKKCEMTITYYFKDRRRHDPSNYDKFLLDGLVEAGIIEDDSYQVINKFTTIGSYDKLRPRTIIEIREIKC